MSLREKVSSLVNTNFPAIARARLTDGESFLESGAIDSFGVMELVSQLDRTFGIKTDDDDLMPDNFDSIELIVGYLRRKGVAE